MKYSAVLTGLLASIAVAAPTAEVERRIDSYTSTDCIDPKDGFHVISAGGEYTTVGNLSLLQTLAQSVLNLQPASKMFQIGYTQGALAPQDISEGIPAFRNAFTSYADRCPNSKIVTLGYSVGAAIIMDTFCGDPRDPQAFQGIDRKYRSNLLANIVYGDLTFKSTQRSALGTCTSGQGVVPRAYPGKCYPFGRKTQSYCDINDPQCCDPGSGDPNVHFQYPSIYDAQATDFVKARWNYWKKHGDN